VYLVVFDLGDSLLAYTDPGRKLCARHAEGISDRSDPTLVWSRLPRKRSESLETVVQPSPSLVIVPCHGRILQGNAC
jgi:hypothetical protein